MRSITACRPDPCCRLTSLPPMTMLTQRITRALATAALAAGTIISTATDGHAQTFSADYAPGCGPGSACTLARFMIGASGDGLSLESLTLTFEGSPYLFAPVDAGEPTAGSYAAVDFYAFPFGGFTEIRLAGSELFIDFLDTGDPDNPGFAFYLDGGGSGYVEVALTSPEGTAPFAFRYSGGLEGGGTISGRVGGASSVVPEPSTVVLLGAGLLTFAAVGVTRRSIQRDEALRLRLR